MRTATIPLAALATFVAVYQLAPAPAAAPGSEPPVIESAPRPRADVAADSEVDRPAPTAPEAGVYYSGCDAVRAAGRAPLFIGQPGYRSEMDGDDDGIACEPHRGRGD